MTRMQSLAGIILALAFAAGGPAAADVWDNATDPDDDIGTDNRLIHGAVQVHDLAFPGAFPDEDVALYLKTLSALDGDTWGQLDGLWPLSP